MSIPNQGDPVLELRVAVTVGDYERLVDFYCAGLGIEPAQFWNNDGGHALVLELGRATWRFLTKPRRRRSTRLK